MKVREQNSQISESFLEISASVMFRCSKSAKEWMVLLLLGLAIGHVLCAPMYYKKTNGDTYEPDLVAISSTVIPVNTYNVNSKDAVKYHAVDDDEYRIAYMNLMHKKCKTNSDDDPDTLITLTKKYHLEKKN